MSSFFSRVRQHEEYHCETTHKTRKQTSVDLMPDAIHDKVEADTAALIKMWTFGTGY